MEVLNEMTFKEKIFDYETKKDWDFKGNTPAIIDFYADWCGPCRALSPILEELDQEYRGKIKIYKIDTEESQVLAALFGIRSIPSMLFIPLKGEPAMVTGLLPKPKLKQAIREVLDVPEPLILEVK